MNVGRERKIEIEEERRSQRDMATAVAVGSPLFSPSMIPLSCKTNLLGGSDGSGPSASSPSSSSSSPFKSRFQKDPSGFRSFPVDFSSTSSCLASGNGSVCNSSSSTALKRKRPARLYIPQMDSTAEATCFRKDGKKGGDEMDVVEVDSTRFSIFCKKGKVRDEMEDRYCADVNINGDAKLAFFGVFDGHGGTKAAEFVANNIEKNVVDEMSRIGGEENGNEIEEAVKTAYLRTDSQLLREEVAGGSCSVTALIRNNDLIVSNAGDCRAIISRGGTAEALTSDHRPSRKDERSRIEHNGGYVDCIRGTWRLQGTLAVSRGIGDAHLKQWVISDPETTILRIKPEYEFLILASDGLWDKVSNQEAIDIARPMCMDTNNALSLSACKKLVDLSVSRGSLDDVSVMIIQLRQFL